MSRPARQRSRLPRGLSRQRPAPDRDTWGPWNERFLAGHPEAPTGLHRAWHNAKYSVQLVRRNNLEVLMVRHHNQATWFPWADLQRIKNDLIGPDREAIQVFPKAAELVDDANMAHLWIIEAAAPLPFTFRNLGWGTPDTAPAPVAEESEGQSLAAAAHAAAHAAIQAGTQAQHESPEAPPEPAAAITVVNGIKDPEPEAPATPKPGTVEPRAVPDDVDAQIEDRDTDDG